MSKNKIVYFLWQCLALSSPSGRICIFTIGMGILAFVDIGSLGLPHICFWRTLFGYCPADGTTRGLNAFFHGRIEEAVNYNLNILLLMPLIVGIFIKDILNLTKSFKFTNKKGRRKKGEEGRKW